MPTASEPTPSATYAADVTRDFGPYTRRDAELLVELSRQVREKHAAEVRALEAEKRELETRLRQFDPVTDARLRAEGR